jgi:hypothetical protein
VQRQVVASEPPKILDVPSHLKFLQKYGGGVKQQMTFSTMSYIASCPVTHVVTGAWLDKLASLTFGLNDKVVRCIHAVLMAQATGPRSKHGVGSNITEQQVKSLMTSKKGDCIAINAMIEKAIHVGQSAGYDMGSAFLSKLIGDLSVNMVLHLFDPDSEFENREDILKLFVSQITGVGISSTAASTTPASTPSIATDIMEYDDQHGGTNAGKLKALQMGWAPGIIAKPKDGMQTKLDEQFEIVYVNEDGSVGMAEVLDNGDLSKDNMKVVKLSDLKNFKRETHRKKQVAYDPTNDDLLLHPETIEFVNKSIAAIGLQQLHDNNTDIKWRFQDKPVNRLICMQQANKGSLYFVPMTTSITVPKTDHGYTEPVTTNHIEISIRGTSLLLNKKVDFKKHFVPLFWLIRQSHNEKDCNMGLKQVHVKVPYCEKNVAVQFTVATNTRKITASEELVLFVPDTRPAKEKIQSQPQLRLPSCVEEPASEASEPKSKKLKSS